MKQTAATQDPLFKTPNPDDWMDSHSAIAALKINRSTLYAMLGDGRSTGHKGGGLRLFWRPEIETLAEALRMARPRG